MKVCRVAWFVVLVLSNSVAVAKSGSEHIKDMCNVFGVRGDNPRLKPIFQSITSEMDNGRTGRQKYTLNQKLKAVEPSFKWGSYTHRLFFHWGFNGDPKKSEPLAKQISICTTNESKRARLWGVVIDEQRRRNSRMKQVVYNMTNYEKDGKRKGIAPEARTGLAALAYDVHIIGDYIEGKDVPMQALASLEGVKNDVIKAIENITNYDPDFEGKTERAEFVRLMKYTNDSSQKSQAFKLLQIMCERVPGILMKSGTFRRVLELEEYAIQSQMKQAA